MRFARFLVVVLSLSCAVALMAASFVILWFTSDLGPIGLVSVGLILVACAAFVVTRPSFADPGLTAADDPHGDIPDGNP